MIIWFDLVDTNSNASNKVVTTKFNKNKMNIKNKLSLFLLAEKQHQKFQLANMLFMDDENLHSSILKRRKWRTSFAGVYDFIIWLLHKILN